MRLIDGDALIDIGWSASEALEANGQIDAYERGMDKVIRFVKSMPTIEPERKKGEWIEDGYYDLPCVCSYCGTEGERKWNFCPNCGSDMRGDDDE